MTLNWNAIFDYALSLPGTVAGTHYGKPTVKANGHALIGIGREAGSFVLHIDHAMKMMLMETDPDTYWQTPHYEGWPSLLVRFDSPDPNRVFEMIQAARDWALTRRSPTSPKRRSLTR